VNCERVYPLLELCRPGPATLLLLLSGSTTLRSDRMSKSPSPEDLTGKQSEALERAAFLVISARNEAAAMLARAGVESPPESSWFGSPCGVHGCGCRNYTGDGCPCLTRTTSDPGASPPLRACGHLPSQHLET
jgi:hypothetical protein